MGQSRKSILATLFTPAAVCATLAACGGGDNSEPPPPPPSGPAPNCASLLSGTYRVIEPTFGAASQSKTITIDAPALQVTDQGSVDTIVPNGECRYTDTSSDVVVSSAGVIVARSFNDDLQQQRVAIAFPEQTMSVADIAGTWNMLGANLVSGSSASSALYTGMSGTLTLSSTGQVSGNFCEHIKTCAPFADAITVSSNPSGGFDVVNAADGSTEHLFAYRAPASGDVMLVDVADDGSIAVFTKQHTNSVSTVGAKSASWGTWMNTSYASTAGVSESSFTTTANDAAAGTWTRESDGDGHVETLYANSPRDGYTHRSEGTAATTAGGTVPVREFTALNLVGMGVSVLWLPSLGQPSAPGALFFSVVKP